MNRDTGLSRRESAVRVPERAIARPPLPKTTALTRRQIREVDLEERMEPLAVSEVLDESDRSLVSGALKLVLVGLTAVGVYGLLPAGRQARPPIELPAAVQGELRDIPNAQRKAEAAAMAVLEEVGPHDAVDDLRACVAAPDASHEAWRFYLSTLAQLRDRKELAFAAADYARRHPDRLEAPHFTAESLRLTDPDDMTEPDGWFGQRTRPSLVESIEECLLKLDAALDLLQRRADDWPSRDRQAWADVLHLDQAGLHHLLWKCQGRKFADPERDRALAALAKVSNADAENVLELRAEIYETLLAQWPKTTFLRRDQKDVPIDGVPHSRDSLRNELAEIHAGIRALAPKGRR